MKKLLLFLLILAAIGTQAQTVNEALIRQQINAVLTTNANKDITATTHRNLMNLMVAYVKYADSSGKESIRQELKYVTPEMFGAAGDSLTDDTDEINAMLAVSAKKYLFTGKYKISSEITLSNSNCTYEGAAGCTATNTWKFVAWAP